MVEISNDPRLEEARRADEALVAAVRRLIQVAALDPTFRDGLVAIAKIVLDELSQPLAEVPSSESDGHVDAIAAPAMPGALLGEAPTSDADDRTTQPGEEIVPMSRSALFALIDEVLPASSATAAPHRPPPIDIESPPTIEERDWVLPGLRDRLRAKAEVTAAFVRAAEDASTVDEALIHRARSSGASLWMTQLPNSESDALSDLEESYRATAEAIDLVGRLRGSSADRPAQAAAMKTLAAAQSALRLAVQRLRPQADEDQTGVFAWLKTTTHDEHVFIDRHMRMDDPLDPSELDQVMADTREALAEVEAETERQEARIRRLGQLKYHVMRVDGGRGSDHDKEKVIEAAAALVEAGLPPSNRDLRDLLMPVLDQIRHGTDKSRAFALVVREIDRNAEESARARRQVPSEGERDPDIERVADLLQGTTIVLVGGEARVEHRAALLEAFRLKDIVWLTLSDDPSPAELRTAIARPEVLVVLQLIRWARHRHGDAAEIAREHGKEFVRIPGGMNPRAVAAAIWDQASDALRQRPSSQS